MNPMSVLAAGIIATMAVATAAIAAPLDDPLQRLRGHARLLIALADSSHDPLLVEQRRIFEAMGGGAAERDLVLVQGIGDRPQAVALRRMFDAGNGFCALLIGKDGGEKLRSARPLGPDQLFALIDSMPMRQEEMRQEEMRQAEMRQAEMRRRTLGAQ